MRVSNTASVIWHTVISQSSDLKVNTGIGDLVY